jgi:hypothetical protein
MSLTDTPRRNYRVIQFDNQKKTGVLRDSDGTDFDISVASLTADCQVLFPDDLVNGTAGSAIVEDLWDVRRADPNGSERPGMESVGPCPDVRGWEPRSNPDTGMRGGRPHDGKFSHPKDEARRE